MHAANTERDLIVGTIRKFVERDVMPAASAMEHRNEYPHELVRQMKEMGLFGLNIPEEYGGADVDSTTFAMVFEEISKGWLGLAGIIGSNSVMCDVLVHFRRHGDPYRSLAAAHLLRCGKERSRRALRSGSRNGQVVRDRNRGRGVL